MLLILCAVFVLSGVAGLIYESIWTRYLGLFVGHSAYAQVLVLVIFLGGMSLGALAIGRRAERVRDPLRWYAGIELAVGVIGLLFHDIFVWTTQVAYDSVFSALGPGAMHVIAKWTIAALLILPQSILLGATFPLMSAGVLRHSPDGAGRKIALLYFANSLGAAVGVLLAGFVFINAAGLPGTLLAAAMANIVVAGVVFVAARQMPARVHALEATAAEGSTPPKRPTLVLTVELKRLLLAVSFGTAVSSFIYEIGWIRMLSLVLGAATHSFELMLSAFILGLAIGAFVIRRRAGDEGDSLRRLAHVQLAMGVLAVITLPIYLKSFEWMAGFMAAFSRAPAGYTAFSISRYVICLAVMLPATICAGMTLPLITRLLLRGAQGERALGQVYGVNTLGSIVGVALAALVVLPLVGLKWMIVLGGLIDVGLGVWLLTAREGAAGSRASLRRLAPALATLAVVVLVGAVTRFDRGMLTSGVFRYGVARPANAPTIVYYADGRTATVSVRRIVSGRGLSLQTNGKPDASLGPEWFGAPGKPTRFTHDASTQLLLPLVTLAHVPDARVAAVIGQGSGMSSHALLGDPALEKVVTIEIEPEMIEASRRFYPANRRVFDDPRARFAIEDARSYFASQNERYDLILSEPSNPWVAGVSGLFTTEFYAHVRRFMTERGVFGQWLHVSEMHDGLVLSVVRAVAENFSDYALYTVSNHDILIVATNGGALPRPDWSVFRRAGIAEDFQRVLPLTPPMLDALRIADAATLAPLVRGGGGNSDFYPTLDLGAERSRYLKEEAIGIVALSGDRFGVARLLEPYRAGPTDDAYTVVGGIPRLEAMELAARVRGGQYAGADPLKVVAAQRVALTERMLASNDPPVDWRAWIDAVRDAEETRAGGSAGVADTAFFARVDRYLARQKPPEEVRAAVRFLRGLADRDFTSAATASDVLLAAAARGELWLPPELLGEGAVVAYLRTGNAPGARAAMPLVEARRAVTDARFQLLDAWIRAAEAAQRAPTAASR
ncbi:MAG TPA: fused MFS/spermidine synthase [Gemmatimonadaceae bacterium]|nr:fused MFS/spermidine synthase [Gemmatimonadaceae bacterium]